MTYISNDPAWWPIISGIIFSSNFAVASFAVVVYDWALTFAQEFELVWMQRWSLMTLLYVGVRYVGMLYIVVCILSSLPVSIIDEGCTIIWFSEAWASVVVDAMLSVIIMAQIHAMYQRSKKMLIFLIVGVLASTITSGVMTVMANLGVSGEEDILSGFHFCDTHISIDGVDLGYELLIPTAVWEILVFLLAVWISIKHLRELRQSPTGSTIGDCFTVLIKSHAFYFLAFAVVACLRLGSLSPHITESFSMGSETYDGILQIFGALRIFVLGPRLLLSVRQYHAKLVARSDGGTGMTSIAFQAGGDALTGEEV